MSEPFGLAGDAAGDFLQIAGDVRELNPEAADPVRKLVDQALAVRADGSWLIGIAGCATDIVAFLRMDKFDSWLIAVRS